MASKVVEKEYNSLLYKYLTILKWKNNDSNSSLEAWNEDKVVADICKIIVKNHITKVSIMFDKTKYVRTEKNLRVTFADQLSNLGMILLLGTYQKITGFFSGGTLGLFTGMSILSLFEVVFWFMKSLSTFLKVPARSKKRRNQYLV